MRLSQLLLLSVLTIPLASEARILRIGDDLIYGTDDRYEVDAYPGDQQFVDHAKSVAIRIAKRRLVDDRDDLTLINFPNRKLKSAVPGLCADEHFLDQVSLGDCTGFLIGKNILMTAGHCISSESDCESYKWAFDFTESTTALKKENVYSCKRIIAQKYEYTEKTVADYAIIELDRDTERAPLNFRTSGKIKTGSKLVVIGHPLGLPMKITDGAKVSGFNDQEKKRFFQSLFLRENYFTADLDTYGGNSGSPVFNETTGLVEGILIQGAEDFDYSDEKSCVQSKHIPANQKNAYEKVMRINRIPELKSLIVK